MPASEDAAELENRLRALRAELLCGQSPWPVLRAWADWGSHFAAAPDWQIGLYRQGYEATLQLWQAAFSGGDQSNWIFQPNQADRRFRDQVWGLPPFGWFAQAQLAAEGLWSAACNVPSMEPRHVRRMEFLGHFGLNAVAPVNFALTNPNVVQAAVQTGGMNFLAGAARLAEDVARMARGGALDETDAFKVGETIAITKGDVVFRNDIMELIQYAPTTPTVRREPILITPAWMLKYYILDLTPSHSLVRYLVDQGFTVFIISWRNPGPDLRNVSFEDYRRNGVLAALDVVGKIVPDENIHAVGYCLGGTLLAIAAAALARDGDMRLASLSLFAAQTDFAEVGDLMLFLDESELAVLEDLMRARGCLDTHQMSGILTLLRAEKMMFSRLVERYMLGKVGSPNDIAAWMTDPTRMAERAHSDYLRQLVLDNGFARGEYVADGRPVSPRDVHLPLFVLAAERDHVVPWQSLYDIGSFGSADSTFVLTGGGHQSGVVSPPSKAVAHYRLSSAEGGRRDPDPMTWRSATEQIGGSWWLEWAGWLDRHSSPEQVAPPSVGCPEAGLPSLGAAPGEYVLQR